MDMVLLGLLVLVAGGCGCLLCRRRPAAAALVGVTAVVSGSALAVGPALSVLVNAGTLSWSVPWQTPALGASLTFAVDPLSAFFLLAIFGLSVVTALFGRDYLSQHGSSRKAATNWAAFALLVASMAAVVMARNAVLFLVAWELMTIFSFVLVMYEDEREDVRSAGWTYLVAAHLGTAFLVAMFLILGHAAGSLEFDKMAGVAAGKPVAGLLFVLALVGFGTKAGFFPLHVWLPEAHPAAPSHVSALMSGVMIKTGIYGLMRLLAMLGPPPLWWGWLLVLIGVVSALFGILLALAQHDIKRLLAYSSVENMGIIAMGLGLGLIGLSANIPSLVVLGYAGALLHVWNHAMFKGLLFLGAGTAVQVTGTREVDRMGGLLKRMPWTGYSFMVGVAAICGLPPLNAFVSEFLLYLGAFYAVAGSENNVLIPAIAIIVGLALAGGLAFACFTKVFGVVFLGEPRYEQAGHEARFGQCLAVTLLAVGCAAAGLTGVWLLRLVQPAVHVMAPAGDALATAMILGQATEALSGIVLAGVVLAALALLLVLRMRALLRRHGQEAVVTWDCGYLRPSPRMQYTASSFVQPLTELFRGILRTQTAKEVPHGLFPDRASLSSATPDSVHQEAMQPVFKLVAERLMPLRRFQHGRVQIYVLYIAVTLLVLLLWKL